MLEVAPHVDKNVVRRLGANQKQARNEKLTGSGASRDQDDFPQLQFD